MLKEICSITSGPVSAEVIADDLEGMLREGREFAKIAPNIVVKVPMTETGLTAISTFADEGIKTNCTLIFSSAQGMLAAKAGATYLSPFVGRLDDISQEGMDMVRELAAIIEISRLRGGDHRGLTRSPRHVIDGALAGAGVATLPFKVFQQMVRHPLTDKGIESFKADWAKASRSWPPRPDPPRGRTARRLLPRRTSDTRSAAVDRFRARATIGVTLPHR